MQGRASKDERSDERHCRSRRTGQGLAIIGASALAMVGWRAWIALFGPSLPYSMEQCPGGSNLSPEFLEFLSTVTNAPIRQARCKPLVNGPCFYPAELEGIRKAERSVDVEMYEWKEGRISDEFLTALTERAQNGVEVRIVLDSIGSFLTRDSIFDRLRAAGGKMFWYHPLRWNTWPRANNRTHRKLITIDGQIAFAGGAGIADHWMSNTKKRGPRWRDTMFCIQGDAVPCLVAAFAENWLEASGDILSDPRQFGFPPADGGAPSLVVPSTPAGGGTTARVLFQALIKSAKKSISITTPYFLPDRSARCALSEAAHKENVRVRILVAGPHIDHPLVRRVSRHDSRRLIKAGAEMYEYQPSMIHAKLMVIDEAWCVFGSTNFDHRSFALNDEVNVATLDRELAARLEEEFERDLRLSRRLTAAMLAPRGILGEAELAAGSLFERES
jgi:cardiolipin synthase